MAEIRVLDKHTAELIAAGEVVERPASVAKELLENAIDAGATQITLSAVRGGIQQLQIVDNGSGIEAEYIDKAFIRHATSKIRTEDDLTSIHTLGFRGEALASIASVARVEVLTRTEADECASLYRIEGGEEQPIEPGARGVGTTIRVCDLFFNTPARMKFLKKDSSEGTFVADIVGHLALSHPEVSFKFIREGKLQYVTPGDGQLRSAAYAVLGREFSRDLVEVDNREGVYRVWGLITQPRSCRASRSMQYFYINGRYVRNRTMMAGMEMAFKGTMDGREVSWRDLASRDARRPCGCQRPSGKNRSPLCPGKRHLRPRLPCRQAGTEPSRVQGRDSSSLTARKRTMYPMNMKIAEIKKKML